MDQRSSKASPFPTDLVTEERNQTIYEDGNCVELEAAEPVVHSRNGSRKRKRKEESVRWRTF
jgi:hypothetical protein